MTAEWEDANKLGCPLLRWIGNKWIALNEDPCPTKKCGRKGCHNYGKPFQETNRFKIIKVVV